MPSGTKKLLLILLALVVIAGLMLMAQIKKTSDITVQTSSTPLINSMATEIPISKDERGQILGNPGAEMTIVEFVDFGSNLSKKIHLEISEFVRKNPTKIRAIWKNFPAQSVVFGNANIAHQGAICAGKQNGLKLWDFADKLAKSNNVGETTLKQTATELKLDMNTWWNCTQSEAAKQKINDDIVLGKSLGLATTPAIFINNKQINWDDKIDLQQMLQTFIQE